MGSGFIDSEMTIEASVFMLGECLTLNSLQLFEG